MRFSHINNIEYEHFNIVIRKHSEELSLKNTALAYNLKKCYSL